MYIIDIIIISTCVCIIMIKYSQLYSGYKLSNSLPNYYTVDFKTIAMWKWVQ